MYLFETKPYTLFRIYMNNYEYVNFKMLQDSTIRSLAAVSQSILLWTHRPGAPGKRPIFLERPRKITKGSAKIGESKHQAVRIMFLDAYC